MALPLRRGFRYGMTLTRRPAPVRETATQLHQRFSNLSPELQHKPRRIFPLDRETKRLLKAEKSKSRRTRIKEAKTKMDALGDYVHRPKDVPVHLWRYVRAHWYSPKATRRTGIVRKKIRKTSHPRAI